MKKVLIFMLCVMVVLCSMQVMPIYAANTMTVDCGNVLRGVTHCASGSLYGITESLPSDINNLVAPLHPYMFTNPARAGSGYQQPIGAAIPVAGRISGTTGKVTIRLADIFPGWPYQFTNTQDWLGKVNSVITDKKNSGYSNFYGYEVWNEPDGTWEQSKGWSSWQNDNNFNNFWLQTYNLIRSNDSGAKIIGPSLAIYNHNTMNSFLSFCKANNCLPDIISWHELDGIQYLAGRMTDYRSLETSLGITALPISINEYCDSDHNLEGQPGSSARYIAKFERYKVDSASISWWFTQYPGRLGSLLATNTQKGAGWYFYKWYGDMSGNMVSVTPPNDASTSIDGAACVDSNAKYISMILGGPNDGTVNVTFNNIPSFIGSSASVKIEAIDWTNKDTVSNGPYTVSTSNYTVTNGRINLTLTGANSSSGYRIYITPGSQSGGDTRYEAENASRNHCNVFNGSMCSNGQHVGQIDYSDSYVQFTVNAPSAGTYGMTVHYANGWSSASTHNVSVNGGASTSISYAQTGGWFAASNSGALATQSVNLNSGSNTIKFTKGTNYAEIDYIDISSLQSGHIYKLVNQNSGKALGIKDMSTSDGGQAIQWSDNGTVDHNWTITLLSDGYYKLTNQNSGKVLGISGMSMNDGAYAIQRNDNGTADCEWKIVTVSGSTYKLVNKQSGKVLGISGMSTSDGANALQWSDNGTTDHNWTLVLVN